MKHAKKLGLAFALLALLAGSLTIAWPSLLEMRREAAKRSMADPRVAELLGKMTLKEKLGQLTQYSGALDQPLAKAVSKEHMEALRRGEVGSFLNVIGAELGREVQRIAVEETRLGIPLLFASDVIHGYRTTFPMPLAESCSWDPASVQLGARVAAIEATAAGIHWTFAPMVDIARDPRWGRIMEGSGEDPFLGSIMAAARVRGFQGDDLNATDTLLACAKHFVAYGAAEGGRDYNTVDISERTLRETYFPPFRAALDAGVVTFMSAFNEVGGIPTTGSRRLQTDVLRHEWGFEGFVVSDWESVAELIKHGVAADRRDAARQGLQAGVDMEMVSGTYIEEVTDLVAAKVIPMELVDQSVRRVLDAKSALGLFDDPYRYHDVDREEELVLAADHREAAREVAGRSIVLLKNAGNTLPFAKEAGTVAVIGPLAHDAASALGGWSAPGKPRDVVTVLQGIRAAVGKDRVSYARGCEASGEDTQHIQAAVELAAQAERVVLVLGETATMSAEAACRSDITLPGVQRELAEAVLALGKPSVVVLINGRPLSIPELEKNAPAIVEAWFLGVETGHAVADVLFGDVNPGGKLTTSFPRAVGQIPIYYNAKNTGRPGEEKTRYTSKYIDLALTPLYPFGHGLSYTQFGYGELSVSPENAGTDAVLSVSLVLENTGTRAGDEVVQLYVRDPVSFATRPVKELRGFQRVALAPAERARLSFEMPVAAMAVYDDDGRYLVEPGELEIMVGSSSSDIRLRDTVTVTGPVRILERPPVAANHVDVERLGVRGDTAPAE